MLKITFHYDVNVMTSYQLSDYIARLFGDKLVYFEEVRDMHGYLTSIVVTVSQD